MPAPVLFVAVAVTAVLYGIIGVWAMRRSRTDPSPRLRGIAFVLFLSSTAFVVSSLQRLGLQAIRSGWLAVHLTDDLLGWWQLVQSLFLIAVAVLAIRVMRGAWRGISHAEQVVSALGGGHPIDTTALTPRERQVLEAISVGTLSDKALAAELGMSRHTAKTHVARILSKTGLHRREELLAAAAVYRERPSTER